MYFRVDLWTADKNRYLLFTRKGIFIFIFVYFYIFEKV
jgi:hypothetical protein